LINTNQISEVDELDIALKTAQDQSGSGSQHILHSITSLLSSVPGVGGNFASQARSLQEDSDAQAYLNQQSRAVGDDSRFALPGLPPDLDPIKVAAQIYPILEFRDSVVKGLSTTIAKIPGLESLVEKISESLMLVVISLLSPNLRPIIDNVSKSLKEGSTGVVEASSDQQFGPWNDSHCTNPTHSMLSKDHFSNKLNGCAGRVATTILQYVAP
jgi:hypothetical protein